MSELEFYRNKDLSNSKLTWRLYSNSTLNNVGILKLESNSNKVQPTFETITNESDKSQKMEVRQGILLLKDIYNTNFSTSISNSWTGDNFGGLGTVANLTQTATEGLTKGISTIGSFFSNGGVMNVLETLGITLKTVALDATGISSIIGNKDKANTYVNNLINDKNALQNKNHEFLSSMANEDNIKAFGSYKTVSSTAYLKQYEGSQIDIPLNLTSRIYNYGSTSKRGNIKTITENDYETNECLIDTLNRLTAYLGPYPLTKLDLYKSTGDGNNNLKIILGVSKGKGSGDYKKGVGERDTFFTDVAPHNFVNRNNDLSDVSESCRKPTPVKGYLTLALGNEYVIPNLLANGFTYTLSTETDENNLPLYADVQIYLRPAFKFTSDWLINQMENLQSTQEQSNQGGSK